MEDIPKPTNKSVGWVAATCQMVMQYQGLALMCRELGQTQKVARNEMEAKVIAERVKSNEGYTSLNLKDGPTADQSC